MFRSLWFRLIGALIGVVLLTLVVLLVVILAVTQQAFGSFVNASGDAVDRIFSESVQFEPPLEVTRVVSIMPPEPEEWPVVIPDSAQESVFVIEESLPIEFLEESVREATRSEGGLLVTQVQRAALAGVLIAGIVAILVGTWLFRQITHPLLELKAAAQSIAGGDLTVRIPVRSRDELSQVAASFNDMARRLERQEGLRRQMVADVAHELRTPLSVMRGNLEALLDGLLELNQEEMSELHDEVLRLTRLVEDLRLLSLADAGELRLALEPVNVGELVQVVVRRMTPLADTGSVRIRAESEQQLPDIPGDHDRLQQALTNLVDNAIRHTPPGSEVLVGVALAGNVVEFQVCDQGPGIAPDDLPFLFERFWRADRSRSRDAGGSGLGLGIVKQIVDLHGGKVWAENNAAAGCRFVIALPLQTAKEGAEWIPRDGATWNGPARNVK